LCAINNEPVNFLTDTGSNRTIVNINTIDIYNHEYGPITAFKQKVLYANGQIAEIIGTKLCLIKVGDWSALFDILIAKHTIRPCILGLDVLTICPHTKPHIYSLKDAIRRCTKILHDTIQNNQKVIAYDELEEITKLIPSNKLRNSQLLSLTDKKQESQLEICEIIEEDDDQQQSMCKSQDSADTLPERFSDGKQIPFYYEEDMYDAELGLDEAKQANGGSYSSRDSYRPRDHADANVESLTYSVFDQDWNQTREDVAHLCMAQAQHSKQTGQYMNPKLKHVDKPICPKSLQAAQDVIMAMLTTIAVN
jgi:hypothetical protein